VSAPPSPAAAGQVADLQREIARLSWVVAVLMDRVEHSIGAAGSDFGLFQTTIVLEERIRERTEQLDAALCENERALDEIRRVHQRLEAAQHQVIQSEKMASIGLLAAGVAHEINNPVGFVNSNLATLGHYVDGLFRLLDAYAQLENQIVDSERRQRLVAVKQEIDLDFLRPDLGALLRESQSGLDRVTQIVKDLKHFSHVDQGEWQAADLNAGLDSTLNVVWNELKYKAEVIKEYAPLPAVECMAGQINQVFMNLLINAAHAIPERGTITLRTTAVGDFVAVAIADTGQGIPPETLPRIFDPFFTTKPVGKGTGLGLSLSFGIVARHGGRIEVDSTPGVGTTFRVWLPVHRQAVGVAENSQTSNPEDRQ